MESSFTACAFCSIALLFGAGTQAQPVPDTESASPLAEVVVTAQKRVSTVQDTPISISAVTGDDLLARGVVSLASLAQGTPGVSLKSEGPSQTEIEMRGMTSSGGNSATVGFYLDDIPLTGPASAQNGHVVIDPDLYDLNRIEILRGPQGTLFGSGSMGGTVRLITNQPNLSQFQSTAQSVLSGTDGGGFNHKDNLMVNLPLIDDTWRYGWWARKTIRAAGSTASWRTLFLWSVETRTAPCAAMSRTPPSRRSIRARMPIKSMRRA
jgi:iron complex outermembrane recepter protein